MFLKRIANAFYSEYEADIRKITFVFPNRRSGLFFRKYLMEIIKEPIFSPEIITINDCFFNASNRKVADRTAELFRLYRIYREVGKTDETFDTFVFWGEMLLSDFNDIDKFHVDAKQIFSNIKALKEIDNIQEYISPEQRSAIEQFWSHFLPKIESDTKEKFIAIWKVMLPLYEQFRLELFNENTATEGMIFREITESLKKGETLDYFSNKNFVFVGFNALNKSEEILFSELKKREQADFYWDYDSAELQDKDNPASYFYIQNTTNFPSKLTIERKVEKLKDKSFQLISIPSSVGQAKEIHALLSELHPKNSDKNEWIKTAVVLPDESLLVPLLHSIPENISNVNVTMGFPLKASPVFGLLENITELQRRINSRGQFYHLVVLNILNHQYVSTLCGTNIQKIRDKIIQTNSIYVDISEFENIDILKSIFVEKKSPAEFVSYLLEVLRVLNLAWQNHSKITGKNQMECDFLYQYYISINRMNEVMKSIGEFEMSLETLIRLIRQLIGGISIPFEGEPLNGLQVMGVLETRGLDFENLIICSFNEGIYPKKSMSNSFIPNNLRRAFGIPTFEYRDAISAYNFYRLIQRSKKLFLLYDNRNDGVQTGEVSRYFHQLQYHYGIDFEKTAITYSVNSTSRDEINVHKTPEIMEKLLDFTKDGEGSRALSASSINMYIDCPLRFYFSYVERIREQDEVQENLDFGPFGTIFHKTMELIYSDFVGKFVEKAELEELRKNTLAIEKSITQSFTTEFFKKGIENADEIELVGKNYLHAQVIKKFVEKILEIDAERTPFKYVQSEAKMHEKFPIQNGDKNVNLSGSIDRVEENDDFIRILDYKTGGDVLKFRSLEQVFERNLDKRPKVVLQTFLYCLLYDLSTKKENNLLPEVLKIREVFKSDFNPKIIHNPSRGVNIPVENFSEWKAEFKEKLQDTIEEIFNPDVPFIQCVEEELCKYCEFKTICKRDVKVSNY